jgi:hypothetical protein
VLSSVSASWRISCRQQKHVRLQQNQQQATCSSSPQPCSELQQHKCISISSSRSCYLQRCHHLPLLPPVAWALLVCPW